MSSPVIIIMSQSVCHNMLPMVMTATLGTLILRLFLHTASYILPSMHLIHTIFKNSSNQLQNTTTTITNSTIHRHHHNNNNNIIKAITTTTYIHHCSNKGNILFHTILHLSAVVVLNCLTMSPAVMVEVMAMVMTLVALTRFIPSRRSTVLRPHCRHLPRTSALQKG